MLYVNQTFSTVLFLQKDEVYLNLVLDYVPETVYRVARHYSRAKQTLPMVYVKVCMSRCAVQKCVHPFDSPHDAFSPISHMFSLGESDCNKMGGWLQNPG